MQRLTVAAVPLRGGLCWIVGNPTIGIGRRPAPPDRTKALAENQIAALWRLDVSLREKTQWKMLYESAARADEVLCLNVEDLYPQDKRGKMRYARPGVDSVARHVAERDPAARRR
ncbi:hypothetical protein [Streptomyces sp. NPDC001933]|uniref:hypothetical protein n=1 Tax=Streptomyces sp. NPDC001933 TaxID=3364626 RepID=UPI00368FE508